MKLVIVMPAYNEASAIGAVLDSLPHTLNQISVIETVVVDDGSRDDTKRVALAHGAVVVRHALNRGVGLATITGLAAARAREADIVVTLDSDGQHDPADLARVMAPILSGRADIVVGTRLLKPAGMPLVRQLGNRLMNELLFIFGGINTTDSQSGFRAYNREALERLKISTSGYEVCTEILVAAKRAKLTVREVPIRVIYTEYSKSKGQSVFNAINTLFRFVLKTITG